MKKRAEFTVNGFVQGVGFRYFAYKHAQILGLRGYTRNLYDGSVIVVAEGEEENIEGMHQMLKKGPLRADVKKVTINLSEFKGEFSCFDIKF